MMKKIQFLGMLVLALMVGCKPLQMGFQEYKPPLAPDFSQEKNWSALPSMEDMADVTPHDSIKNLQAEAKVDVFFIHPTIFKEKKEGWNASVANAELNAKVDGLPVKHQASVFNGSGRIYAPRYRQMNLYGFYVEDTASKRMALELAYQDVKAAFEYYLAHYNEGRPIILASHSQGTWHGRKLLEEFFDGTDLQPQLVAAYLVGYPFKADRYESIPVCEGPLQTTCVMGWNTYREGYEPKYMESFYEDAVVVNPVNWQTDEAVASVEDHLGLLMGDYEKLYPQSVSTQIHENILWVSRPKIPFAWLAPIKRFHKADYNLFWLNVRENVADRVEAYFERMEAQNQ